MTFLDLANTYTDSLGVQVVPDQLAADLERPDSGEDSREDTDEGWPDSVVHEHAIAATDTAEDFFENIIEAVEVAEDTAEEHYADLSADREATSDEEDES